MNYMTKESIMNRLQEHYEYAENKANGEVFAIFLQGSQNYIDDKFFKNSDVDSRVIFLPNMKDICLGNDISQPELILNNGEHIDRFDIRKFLQLIKTPGINNYENLFTEYYIVNPKYEEFHNRIREIRENIVRINEKKFLMATMGVSKRDLNFLTKRRGGEDYDIETFGYSRKRLANIMRFNLTIKAYLENKPFSECLKAMDQDLIHKIRRTECYTLGQALELAKSTDKESRDLAHNFKPKESENAKIILGKLDEVFVKLMTKGANVKDTH